VEVGDPGLKSASPRIGFGGIYVTKKQNAAGRRCLTPVIPSTQEQRSGGLQFQASPGK
jgi:hypothetical protein